MVGRVRDALGMREPAAGRAAQRQTDRETSSSGADQLGPAAGRTGRRAGNRPPGTTGGVREPVVLLDELGPAREISSSSSPVCRATTVALTAAAVTLVAVRAMSAITPIGMVAATNSSGSPAAAITVAADTVAAPGTPATPTETTTLRSASTM